MKVSEESDCAMDMTRDQKIEFLRQAYLRGGGADTHPEMAFSRAMRLLVDFTNRLGAVDELPGAIRPVAPHPRAGTPTAGRGRQTEPVTPPVGEGWIRLEGRQTVLAGDEVWDGDTWVATQNVGGQTGPGLTYRRRAVVDALAMARDTLRELQRRAADAFRMLNVPVGMGYRLLYPGERLEAGDMTYAAAGGWLPVQPHQVGFEIPISRNPVIAARFSRTEPAPHGTATTEGGTNQAAREMTATEVNHDGPVLNRGDAGPGWRFLQALARRAGEDAPPGSGEAPGPDAKAAAAEVGL